MRNKLLIFLLLIGVLAVKGQELTIPQLSQYLADNPFVMSPTYAGIGDHVKIRVKRTYTMGGDQRCARHPVFGGRYANR